MESVQRIVEDLHFMVDFIDHCGIERANTEYRAEAAGWEATGWHRAALTLNDYVKALEADIRMGRI